MSDDWKARAEKAEEHVKFLQGTLADVDFQADDWKVKAYRAEAACAEMRAALEKTMHGVAWGQIVNDIRRALSSDAGKGWVSPEEHALASYNANDFYCKYAALKKSLGGWAPPEVVAQAAHVLKHVCDCIEEGEDLDMNQVRRVWCDLQALREVAK